jgi:tRNA modification GTPase
MKKTEYTETIIAPLTPVTGGSVALLRISGSKAVDYANRFFTGSDLSEKKGGRFFFGSLKDIQGEIVDEIVLSLFRNPHSYTGEDVVEISCHANPFIVNQIIQLFLNAGCRMAEAGEFTKRAFLNGKMDLVQAEAVAEIIAAQSAEGVKNSLSQLKGNLSKQINKIRSGIIRTASFLELDLDFTEEDLEIIHPKQVLDETEKTIDSINTILETYKQGTILSKGIDVLITGKPNVGKSSLMNALLNEDRVIVSDKPGTTRDIIHEETVIQSTRVRFFDSAGIRLTDSSIEAEGVERARNQFKRADVILLLVDGSEPLSFEDENLLKTLSQTYNQKTIVIKNKSDLNSESSTREKIKKLGLPNLSVSAKKRTNIKTIKDLVIRTSGKTSGDPQSGALLSNQRQYQKLIAAKEHLQKAAESIRENIGYEFAAVDLRAAIQNLSEITGEITTDDILNSIFADFCIGK